MITQRERVISITLSEAEWQAFIARQPQPVSWLRERIHDEVVGKKLQNLQPGTKQSGTKTHESRTTSS